MSVTVPKASSYANHKGEAGRVESMDSVRKGCQWALDEWDAALR